MRRPIGVLALALTALGGPAAAAPLADGGVNLPVIPSALAAGASCTAGSSAVAKAVPWEQRSLGLARVWRTTGGSAGGAGVTVAVVDTGVAAQAPALAGRVTSVGAADGDCVGHGTFVAGLIAAAPSPQVRFAGVASGARVLAVRGTDARGGATAASLAAGIRSAAQAGAEVIVVSPALEQGSADLTGAVAYAAKRDALVIAAAAPDPTGPAGASPPPPRDYWPASDSGVLSVLDVDAKGSRPANAPSPLRADLAAPGDGVVGVGPSGKGHYIGSGASLAAAYVAGTAALVRSAHPDLTATQTAARLTGTAYPSDVPRLDPYAAVTAVRTGAAPRGGGPQEPPVRLASDTSARTASHRALATAALGVAVGVGVAWAAAIVRLRSRSRRRAGGGGELGQPGV
ncbi:S8 family serine peptidase [Streptomyces griseorubiginosus]|uniref:S8 family serine peptidase n=1 Tax=Streptomyces griseorubiginosus TaxID=67304 RepID=UPI0036EC1DD1